MLLFNRPYIFAILHLLLLNERQGTRIRGKECIFQTKLGLTSYEA